MKTLGIRKRGVRFVAGLTAFCFAAQILGENALASVKAPAAAVSWNDLIVGANAFEEIFPAAAEAGKRRDRHPLVYLVCEAHSNPAYQRQIARILERLDRQAGLDAVFVEGTSTGLETEIFHAAPSRIKAREVLGKYLDQGLLTGAEYFTAVREKGPIPALGVENEALYAASHETLRHLFAAQPELEKRVAEMAREHQKAAPAYSEKAARIRRIFAEELLNPRRLPDPGALRRAAGDISPERHPVLFRFCLIHPFLQSLEKTTASGLTRQVAAAAAHLPPEDQKRFIEALSREPKPQTGAFYHGLYRFFSQADLTQAPAEKIVSLLWSLLNVTRTAEWVEQNLAAARAELEELEEELLIEAAATDGERRHAERGRQLRLLGKLIRTELLSQEWRRHFEEGNLLEGWEEAALPARFYELARTRDTVMAANLLEQCARSGKNPRAVALVVGGFHEEGIRRAFEKWGVRHVAISPLPDGSRLNVSSPYRQLIEEGGGAWQKLAEQLHSEMAPTPVLARENPEMPETAKRFLSEIGAFREQAAAALEASGIRFDRPASATPENRGKLLAVYFGIEEKPGEPGPEEADAAFKRSVAEFLAGIGEQDRALAEAGVAKRAALFEQLGRLKIGVPVSTRRAAAVLAELAKETADEKIRAGVKHYLAAVKREEQKAWQKAAAARLKLTSAGEAAGEKTASAPPRRRNREAGFIDMRAQWIFGGLMIALFMILPVLKGAGLLPGRRRQKPFCSAAFRCTIRGAPTPPPTVPGSPA